MGAMGPQDLSLVVPLFQLMPQGADEKESKAASKGVVENVSSMA